MRQVRAKVWQLRTESDLFNVQTYTSNLERVYRKVWEKYEKGEEVSHLTELAEPYSWLLLFNSNTNNIWMCQFKKCTFKRIVCMLSSMYFACMAGFDGSAEFILAMQVSISYLWSKVNMWWTFGLFNCTWNIMNFVAILPCCI